MNKIAFLNDGLRRTFARGRVVMTPGVAELPEERLTQVLERVRHFDEFTPDNDPHGDHDFGSFEIAGVSPPSSVAAGDLLLANISVNGGNSANITAPSGWTQILRTDNDTSISIVSYYRIASASEPSNYTWTIDHQTTAKGEISRYTGVDTTNPIDASAGNIGFGTVATTTPLTTSANNEQIVTSCD